MGGELRLEEEEWEETFVSQEHFEEDDIGMEKIWQVRKNAKSYVVFRFRNLSTVGVCCISNMIKHDLSLLCHYFVSLCIRYTPRHVGCHESHESLGQPVRSVRSVREFCRSHSGNRGTPSPRSTRSTRSTRSNRSSRISTRRMCDGKRWPWELAEYWPNWPGGHISVSISTYDYMTLMTP